MGLENANEQEYNDALKAQRQEETARADKAEADLRDVTEAFNDVSRQLGRAKGLLTSTKEALGVVREDRNKMIERLRTESGAAAGRYEKLRKERDNFETRLKDECDATKLLSEQATKMAEDLGNSGIMVLRSLRLDLSKLRGRSTIQAHNVHTLYRLLCKARGVDPVAVGLVLDGWAMGYAKFMPTALATLAGVEFTEEVVNELCAGTQTADLDSRPSIIADGQYFVASDTAGRYGKDLLEKINGPSPEIMARLKEQFPNGAMVTSEGLKPMPQDLRTKEEKILEFLDRLNTWFDLEDKTSRANAAKALLDLMGR